MSLPSHFLGSAGYLAATAELGMARRMLNWRLAFNRRELTGIRLQDGTQIHAARSRRIV